MLSVIPMSGCKHQLFLEPSDHKSALSGGLEYLEKQPHSPIPPSLVDKGGAPATALDPTRPARNVTLKECIAIGIEKGNLGIQGGVLNAGLPSDSLPLSFSGQTVGGTDSIRALVIDPAIVGANIERSLSKFDARWITSLTWAKNDQPVVNFQQQLTNGDSATLSSTFAKPLPTGGVAGITFSTDYRKFNQTSGAFNSQLNPAYTPRVQFLFEQPLLQGFGIEINQLAQSHPGSLLISGLRPSGGTTTEGILVTRIRYDQQRAEFDRQLNQMLFNIETAYWNLYAAYYNLYAQEETLKQAFELYTVIKKRFEVGTVRQQELTQTESQYWTFRRNVLEARNQILDAERNLRGLLGETSFADGMRLVPIDEPTLAPYMPDYYEQANEALATRPELIIARHDLKFRQLDLILQKNQRRPDLRFFASQDIAGIGTRLDGSDEVTTSTTGTQQIVRQNALANFANNDANSWQLGLRMDVPLGFRDANAAVRQSQLAMLRSYYQLHDAERKILENVVRQYRNVIYRHQDIILRRQTRVALEQTLALNQKLITGGAWDTNTLFNVLQVQQNFATNLAAEFQSIAQYNTTLAALEFEKGTIQRYNNVSVGDGPLPQHVGKKASDHFSARNAALKLRERSDELPLQSLSAPWDPSLEKLPAPNAGGNISLPGMPYAVPATGMPLPSGPGMTMPTAPSTPTTPMSPAMPVAGGSMMPTSQPLPVFTEANQLPSVRPWPGAQDAQAPPAVFTPIGTAHIPTRAKSGGSTPVEIPPSLPISTQQN
ncbi:TolC family protein [Limnoglobus roseus]|uniref:TolC family protein n=1 Tax=Limnoglobus roseus TaxID=2598579 RepID=UPI00143D1D6C|nr:TolC family protein [Limnoglobus roseus]